MKRFPHLFVITSLISPLTVHAAMLPGKDPQYVEYYVAKQAERFAKKKAQEKEIAQRIAEEEHRKRMHELERKKTLTTRCKNIKAIAEKLSADVNKMPNNIGAETVANLLENAHTEIVSQVLAITISINADTKYAYSLQELFKQKQFDSVLPVEMAILMEDAKAIVDSLINPIQTKIWVGIFDAQKNKNCTKLYKSLNQLRKQFGLDEIDEWLVDMPKGEDAFFTEENGNCCICQCQFDPKKRAMVTLHCNHSFDAQCLKQWFDKGTNVFACPLCRKQATAKDIAETEVQCTYFVITASTAQFNIDLDAKARKELVSTIEKKMFGILDKINKS